MDLQQLRSFVAVARSRHFTRAAEELHIGQPAVSQHIRRLEAELGVRLLNRTTRAVQLTDAGALLLARAERALHELSAGLAELDELKGLLRGRLMLGAMQLLEPYDLPGTLSGFHDMYPAIEIRVIEEASVEMIEAVLADELDAAFVPLQPGLSAQLSSKLLFEDELVLVLARGHPLARRESVRLQDVRDESFVFMREGANLRSALEDAAREAGFEAHPSFETNELSRVLALVGRGLGVSAVSSAVAEAASHLVASVRLRPAVRRRVALIWRKDRHHSPAAKAFLDYARGK